MSIDLEPKEVLEHLHSLGYCNITPEQLKDFIKDLKKLIRHDQKRTEERYFRTEEKLNSYRSLQKEEEAEVPCTCPKSTKTVKHVDMALESVGEQGATGTQSILRRPASQNNEYSNSELDSSEYSDSQDPKVSRGQGATRKENIPPRPPSSFIRPASRSRPKNDPVALYHYYQNIWSQNPKPGDDPRSQLRWSVRHQMMGEQKQQPQSCGCPCCVNHLQCQLSPEIPPQEQDNGACIDPCQNSREPAVYRKTSEESRPQGISKDSCQCAPEDVTPLSYPPDCLKTKDFLDLFKHKDERVLIRGKSVPGLKDNNNLEGSRPPRPCSKGSRVAHSKKTQTLNEEQRKVTSKIAVHLNVDDRTGDTGHKDVSLQPSPAVVTRSGCVPLCPKCGKKKELEDLARAKEKLRVATKELEDLARAKENLRVTTKEKESQCTQEEPPLKVACVARDSVPRNIKVVTEINLG